MDKDEAIQIANKALAEYRTLSYFELAKRIDEMKCVDVVAPSGEKCQFETQIFWDGKKGGDIRVTLGVVPVPLRLGNFFGNIVNLDFIKAPDGTFVGEEITVPGTEEWSDLPRRKEVWQVLSEFYLDTSFIKEDYVRIGRVLKDSSYSWDEIRLIFLDEVTPAVSSNMMWIAGEWSGFDAEWLEKRIRNRKHRWFYQNQLRRTWRRIFCAGMLWRIRRLLEKK